MKYVMLGNSGLKVSQLCFGCMTFGDKFYNIGSGSQDAGITSRDRQL